MAFLHTISLLLPVFRRRVQGQDGPGRNVRGAQRHVAAEEENDRKPGKRNPSEFAVPLGRRVCVRGRGLFYTRVLHMVRAHGAGPGFRRVRDKMIFFILSPICT